MATLSKDVEIKILKDVNQIDPSSDTSDWKDSTADFSLKGFARSLDITAPKPNVTTISYLGSDDNGAQLEEHFIESWEKATVSLKLGVNPDSTGTYVDLDSLLYKSVASGTSAENFVAGVEIPSNTDLLIIIGNDYGVRYLFKNVKITSLDSVSVPEKGLIELTLEAECLASDFYKQVVKSA